MEKEALGWLETKGNGILRDEGLYLVSCIFSSSFFATVCCLERLLTLPRMFVAFNASLLFLLVVLNARCFDTFEPFCL